MNTTNKLKLDYPKRAGWTPLLVLVSAATTLGTAIPVGYLLGVVNTPAVYIKEWCIETLRHNYDWHLSEGNMEVLWAAIVSIFLVGGIFGSFAGAWLCDKFGRKGCLLISAVLLTISGFLFNFCREAGSVEMLLIGRFLGGVASAFIYTAHPMYLVEIAPMELRDAVGVFTSVGVTFGIVVGQIFSLNQIFGTDALWQYALSFYTLLVIVSFLPYYWFPESPVWLYNVKQQEKSARAALESLRGASNHECINQEMLEMERAAAAKSKLEKNSFWSVVRSREMLLPLVLVCSLQISQQLSGINAIWFYSVPIFKKAGFSQANAAWLNLAAGFLNLFVSALGPLLMAKCNRRPMLMISCTGCFVALFGLSFALEYINSADWLPAFCICLMAAYIIIYQFGLGPIPYFIGSELFDVTPRPVGMSMGSLFSWTGNFMIGMCFPLLEGAVGSFAFLPCCLICVYCFCLTWFYLPESRGRDPTDLAVIMKDGLKSKVIVILSHDAFSI